MNIIEAFPPRHRAGVVANFGEAERVARALKGHRGSKGWVAKCPCHDDRTASLSITDGDDGRLLLHCFAGCEFNDIKDVLRDRGHLGTDRMGRARRTLAYVASAPADHEPDSRALALWRDADPLFGTPVQIYLERRGILIMPPSLRCHGGSRAMLAAVQRPDGKIVAVQSTFLTLNGAKAAVAIPKVTTGALGGGAVRFAAAAEVMGIAEGVETALSAMVMAEMPVWASLGSQRLDRVVLPDLVREVHIFADRDAPGRKGADLAAEKHLRDGRTVELHFPPDGINDFNDLLLARADCDGDDDRLTSRAFDATSRIVASAA
jgi:putative DNA primase/helicase